MRFHNEACAVPNPAIRDFTEISIRLSCLKPQRRLKMRNESQFATTLSGDAPASSVASSGLPRQPTCSPPAGPAFLSCRSMSCDPFAHGGVCGSLGPRNASIRQKLSPSSRISLSEVNSTIPGSLVLTSSESRSCQATGHVISRSVF